MIALAPGDECPEPAMGVSLAGWGLGQRGAGLAWAGRVLPVAPGDPWQEGAGMPSWDGPVRAACSRLGPFNRGE